MPLNHMFVGKVKLISWLKKTDGSLLQPSPFFKGDGLKLIQDIVGK